MGSHQVLLTTHVPRALLLQDGPQLLTLWMGTLQCGWVPLKVPQVRAKSPESLKCFGVNALISTPAWPKGWED